MIRFDTEDMRSGYYEIHGKRLKFSLVADKFGGATAYIEEYPGDSELPDWKKGRRRIENFEKRSSAVRFAKGWGVKFDRWPR